MMMKKRIIEIVVFIFLGFSAFGQSPDWTVNENNFEYTMTLVAFVTIDGNKLSSTNDMLGAFVGNELRGATNLIYVPTKDRYYAYLTVFSNTNNETIRFKAYDSSQDKIVAIEKSLSFSINSHRGNLLQAFSVASPALNSQADIVSLEFKDVAVLNNSTIDDNINLYVENGTNVTALNLVFELSTGAKLLHNSGILTSEDNALDFSSAQQLQVLSEDESTLEDWTVSVLYNAVIGNITFYKQDAVCYTGGAIKIVLSGSNAEVVLFKDDVEQVTQNLVEGEAVFKNLETGDYTVRINDFEKNVTINITE
jgi:hypothetical protein